LRKSGSDRRTGAQSSAGTRRHDRGDHH